MQAWPWCNISQGCKKTYGNILFCVINLVLNEFQRIKRSSTLAVLMNSYSRVVRSYKGHVGLWQRGKGKLEETVKTQGIWQPQMLYMCKLWQKSFYSLSGRIPWKPQHKTSTLSLWKPATILSLNDRWGWGMMSCGYGRYNLSALSAVTYSVVVKLMWGRRTEEQSCGKHWRQRGLLILGAKRWARRHDWSQSKNKNHAEKWCVVILWP